MTTLPLPDAIADDLKAAAADHGPAVEQFLEMLLAKHRQKMAWALTLSDDDVSAGLATLKEHEQTGEAIPAEEVFAYLKSLHTDKLLPPPVARKLKHPNRSRKLRSFLDN
jgi:hypothetical protein